MISYTKNGVSCEITLVEKPFFLKVIDKIINFLDN